MKEFGKTSKGDIKQKRLLTQQLDEENQKMEIRLQELKLAMNREKEEREGSGGNFWGKGQPGALHTYKPDLPGRETLSGSKPKKVAILKHEPIVVPKRVAQPGTMAYLANKDPAKAAIVKSKVKGPKCGQCEEMCAVVICQECSEHYCAKCFAAFHLKGALRKHRSLPISTTTPRQAIARRVTAGIGTDTNPENVPAEVKEVRIEEEMVPQKVRPAPPSNTEAPSSNTDVPSMQKLTSEDLQGDFDEDKMAEEFKRAVMEWRQQTTQPQVHIVQASHCTGTVSPFGDTPPRTPQLDLHFTSSLTYAEKLLLKQHRRVQLDPFKVDLQPPRDEVEMRAQLKQRNGLPPALEREKSWAQTMEHINFEALRDMALGIEPAWDGPLSGPNNAPHSPVDGQRTFRIETEEHRPVSQVVIEEEVYTPRIIHQNDRPPSVQPTMNHCDQDASKTIDLCEVAPEDNHKADSNDDEFVVDSAPEPISRPTSKRSMRTPRGRKGMDFDRPVSRTKMRPASSLESGRLTSAPLTGLRQVTARAAQAFADDTLLSGLYRPDTDIMSSETPRSARQKPSSARTASAKARISNKFYTIGPRSWKPDQSVCLNNEAWSVQSTQQTPREMEMPVVWSDVAPVEDVMDELARINELPQTTITPRHVPRFHVNMGAISAADLPTEGFTTPRRPISARSADSHPIVVEGDDMTRFDTIHPDEIQEDHDYEVQLENEIITEDADGPLSTRESLRDSLEDDVMDSDDDTLIKSGRSQTISSPTFSDHDKDELECLDSARYNDSLDVENLS